MENLIKAFPQNITDAIEIASKQTFSSPKNEITNVVICGMGGSGIGGKIVSQWVSDQMSIPVVLLHDYTTPAFISKNTLVIASTYSGDTEETLMSVDEAFEKGAHIIAVTSGGKMQQFCKENGFDCVIVPGGNPPRSAIAFSLVQLMNIFVKLGYIPASNLLEIASGRDLIVQESNDIHAKAKVLAQFLAGKVGVFYAGPKYEGLVVRARQQFNENSKLLCWHHVLPEMNHNELVGWGGGDERFAVAFFNTGDLIPRNKKRYDITMDVVKSKGASTIEVFAKGTTQIQKTIYLINYVDWASFYLSEINQVDIMDIKIIDFLKSELAKF